MDSFDSNDPLRDGDVDLWRLLGKAHRAEASPYFARKVLRAVETASQPAAWWRFLLKTVAPAAVCAGIAIAALVGLGGSSPKVAETTDIEFETIQSLDLLVSNYESSIWLDSTSPSR